MGLPPSALAFLRENTPRKDPCPYCGRDNGLTRREIGFFGMFDEIPLNEYTLRDGRTAREVIQHEIWSSGPMTWLKLVVSDGTEFAWEASQIVE
jgi:hypothetical protein